MKLKLLVGTFACVCMLMFAFANTSFAAGYAPGTCTIDKVGAAHNNFFFVTCPEAGYSTKWFKIGDEYRNELLAVLLTAFSSDQEVEIYIEDDGKTVTRIRMAK